MADGRSSVQQFGEIKLSKLDELSKDLDFVLHKYADLKNGILTEGWRCRIRERHTKRVVIGYGEGPAAAVMGAFSAAVEAGIQLEYSEPVPARMEMPDGTSPEAFDRSIADAFLDGFTGGFAGEPIR